MHQHTLRPFIRRQARTWQTVDVVMLEGGRRVALLPLSRLEPMIGSGVSANRLHGFGRFNLQNWLSFPST
jgi:hypothetical protein